MPYTPLDRPGSIPEAFVEAWNARDPAAPAAIFDEDAEFVNVTGRWWHGRATIEKVHAYALQHIFSDSTLTLVRAKVKRLREDVAVVHARMRLSGQSAVEGAEEPGVRTNIFSFIVHRTPDGWRCASVHNTDVVPGMKTNVIDGEGRMHSINYEKWTSDT